MVEIVPLGCKVVNPCPEGKQFAVTVFHTQVHIHCQGQCFLGKLTEIFVIPFSDDITPQVHKNLICHIVAGLQGNIEIGSIPRIIIIPQVPAGAVGQLHGRKGVLVIIGLQEYFPGVGRAYSNFSMKV